MTNEDATVDKTVKPKTGPRKAPEFYAGETYRGHRIQHDDVERHGNGSVKGKRNKHMRRLIRKALKRKFSSIERARGLGQQMLAQAREIAKDEKRCSRYARRLFAAELAIHTPVYAPTQAQGRALRTKIRANKRAGKGDAISQLVDAMSTRR